METGCRAAAVGGFTAVSPMANTDPAADNAAVIHEVLELGRTAGTCDVFPVGAITRGLEGEAMAELGEMFEAGVRLFSDDGRCVPDARVLRNALTYVRAFEDAVIAEHCEDASLAEGGQMHEGLVSSSLGLAGQPREAEEVVVARDLAVARLTGGRLHLCHLSSAGSVEMVRRAKAEGLRVTAEVTPHHLAFADEDLVAYDTNLKMNPPLRSPEDRAALRAGLADGTIDAVATDHAPHAVEEKEAEFDQAPFGTIGLETALAAVLTHLVEPGQLSLTRAIEAMSTAPRGSSAPPTTADRSSPAGRRTWSRSTRRPSGRSSRRSPRRAGTPRSSAAPCAVEWCTRCSAASSSSRTGRRSGDGRTGRAPGAGGRQRLPRARRSARPGRGSARRSSTRACPATRRCSRTPRTPGRWSR